MIKNILKMIADRLGYIILKKGLPRDLAEDSDFIHIYEQCKEYTMVPSDRTYALYKSAHYIAEAGIMGAVVECGVWRGGQSMLVAKTLLAIGDTSREFWLYDTYTGMSEPTNEDVYIFNGKNARVEWENSNRPEYNDWCYASLDEVKKNLDSTSYPADKFKFIKGKVEDTIPQIVPEQISILRLDTDWYESTKHELEYLYPRLVVGGVLIIDDYGSWTGARKAVDEYFSDPSRKILLTKVGEGRVGVKYK